MKYFKEDDDHLVATFEFKDFECALAFVNLCGSLFEQQNHHPDIAIYDYKYVTVKTTTHDSGNTLTDKDYQLVEQIEQLVDNQ